MRKLMVVCALALAVALVPGAAFASAVVPVATGGACAGCAAGLHRVVCPTAFAQPLLQSIAGCATQMHGCLGGGYVDADGDGLCDRYEDGTCPRGEACPADGLNCPRHGDACPNGEVCPADGLNCPQHGDACPNGACPADGLNCPRHGDACPNAATVPDAATDSRAEGADDAWNCPRTGHHGSGHGCGNGAGHGCRR
ncbi:hypothetical protein [uncultured Adlercreutzia sp.]|uniref:hypothetical protein n=1 Tax=uncultured Adlercreutzia sp. TaxID=875803 RepID=UPI0026F390F1|nr:hypothetical protein [uncultured Adlercreutzia sp.]